MSSDGEPVIGGTDDIGRQRCEPHLIVVIGDSGLRRRWRYCRYVSTPKVEMATQISSREFNQDTSGAKKAAEKGPVYITDRGRPAHVLLTFDAYEKLIGTHRVLDLLAEPAGVEDIELPVPRRDDLAEPVAFA